MRNLRDYLIYYNPITFRKNKIKKIIEQVRIDAWNDALEWAAENATTTVDYFFDEQEGQGHYKKTVSKKSILDGKL